MTHRLAEPDLRPRTIAVAGLGPGGRRLAGALDPGRMPQVWVVDVPLCDPDSGPVGADDLALAFDGADMILVVCQAGDDVGFAGGIARIANHRGVLVTGVVIDSHDAAGGGNADLKALRRACDLVVIASDDEALQAMVAALGR